MKKRLFDLGMIITGNFLLAFSVCAFIVPLDITVGGATGIGVICDKAFGLPMWAGVLAVNIICLPLAWIFVGRRLVVRSLISSFVYPLALSLTERIPGISGVTDSLILSAVYAGVIGGAGVGLVMKAEGSTGGMDIPPVILQKKMNIRVKTSMYLMDALIMLAQLPYCETDRVLYGIVSAYIFTRVIDSVLLAGERMYDVTVVTDGFEMLRERLLENDFGVTLREAESGLLKKPFKEISTTVSSSSLKSVQRLIRGVDENAFVRITKVVTVLGRGFDREKITLERKQ